MPVTPSYTFTETLAGVFVDVAIKGVVVKGTTAVFTSRCFIKVNAPPYLFACDLFGDVDVANSSATVDAKGVSFKLAKVEQGMWGQLQATGDKRELMERRNAAIEEEHERTRGAHEKKKSVITTASKNATDRTIDMDSQKRQTIEARKEAELQAERDDIDAWKASLESGQAKVQENRSLPPPPPTTTTSKSAVMEEDSDEDEEEEDEDEEEGSWAQEEAERRKAAREAEVPSPTPPSEQPLVQRNAAPAPAEPPPPPRATAPAVKAKFTELESKMPARESREVELKKLRDDNKRAIAARSAEQDGESLADRQPLFLKDRGDVALKRGDFGGAIRAYNLALEKDPNVPGVYANRAIAHMKREDYESCVEDCTAALVALESRFEAGEFLTDDEAAARNVVAAPTKIPTTSDMRAQRFKLLMRRSSALGQMALPDRALTDAEAALRLRPDDQDVAVAVDELRVAASPDSAAALRTLGERRFGAKDYGSALEVFGSLVTLLRTSPDGASSRDVVSAIANRAACRLALADFDGAVLDCDDGLATLLDSDGDDHPADSRVLSARAASTLSIPDAAANASLGAMLLARKASAFAHLRRRRESAETFRHAGSLRRAMGDAGTASDLEADALAVETDADAAGDAALSPLA
ncbi:dynein axonemal assembly factor 4 [Pycnococcus provasolii]